MHWHGNKVKELAFSIGVASSSGFPDCSILDLIKMADHLMYQDKNEYYIRTGKERRKQKN